MGTWGLPPSHGTATSLPLLPTLCFQHFPPKKGWPQPVARCTGAGGRALPGGATRGQWGPFGALTRSLCLSLPPRCVFRSARAASKRGPRWAAARRGVPTPTTTHVPSTQVSPPAAGTGGGTTWGPPHPKAPSEPAEIGDGVGWGLPVADGEVLGVPNFVVCVPNLAALSPNLHVNGGEEGAASLLLLGDPPLTRPFLLAGCLLTEESFSLRCPKHKVSPETLGAPPGEGRAAFTPCPPPILGDVPLLGTGQSLPWGPP